LIRKERRTGSCKWFNVLKGFGFIILDNTLEDVFVHQSELKMEGFRSLEEGERVSFFVRTRNSGQRVGALEAWQVCSALLFLCGVSTDKVFL
uniref:CSD_1 domain-containing protein n=1 Tax=Angiostrongylus cantonensis TaxID=6313 RepID=A0A0K0DM42_ANGCA